MNYWTEQSVIFANQKNYLDELFKVYPISPNIRREISNDLWEQIWNNGGKNGLMNISLEKVEKLYVHFILMIIHWDL